MQQQQQQQQQTALAAAAAASVSSAAAAAAAAASKQAINHHHQQQQQQAAAAASSSSSSKQQSRVSLGVSISDFSSVMGYVPKKKGSSNQLFAVIQFSKLLNRIIRGQFLLVQQTRNESGDFGLPCGNNNEHSSAALRG
jgi:mannose-1-phosphate guanylyltransferase